MKKLLLALLVLPFIISSCSSDDDNNYYNSNANLIGTWYFLSITPATVETNNADITKQIEEDITYNEADENDLIIFRADGTFYANDGEVDYDPTATDGTYSIDGNQLTLTNKSGDKNTMTISISGDQFSVYNDNTETYQYDYKGSADVVITKVIEKNTYKRK